MTVKKANRKMKISQNWKITSRQLTKLTTLHQMNNICFHVHLSKQMATLVFIIYRIVINLAVNNFFPCTYACKFEKKAFPQSWHFCFLFFFVFPFFVTSFSIDCSLWHSISSVKSLGTRVEFLLTYIVFSLCVTCKMSHYMLLLLTELTIWT